MVHRAPGIRRQPLHIVRVFNVGLDELPALHDILICVLFRFPDAVEPLPDARCRGLGHLLHQMVGRSCIKRLVRSLNDRLHLFGLEPRVRRAFPCTVNPHKGLEEITVRKLLRSRTSLCDIL